MTPVERFIIRHAWARYAFVVVGFPIVAVADRVRGIWNPAGRYTLRNALTWAREGGTPGEQPARAEPAPMSPRWGGPPAPMGPVEDWPWGQEPGEWMLDPMGLLAGPLANPEGWIAAHRSNIDGASR
ncbi:hypothetical protein [Paractinoplanes toevensis]|uniref:Uncharacterized protein n=1 Tax=Paractinoplanes toevensis TaxID=571911 RepID=A0A919T3N8_9ACTN|nr:hypothetical protein [Actinoplanes toevensis]GIM88764.1 hypothetical protein Ato02nite_005570 [Actinoplanes toevensis]